MIYVDYFFAYLAWGGGLLWEYFSQAPPWALWIMIPVMFLLGYATNNRPSRMSGPSREDTVRRLVSDRLVDMLMMMCDNNELTWEEAAAEMSRLGRSWRWGDFTPRRLRTYHLSKGEQLQLKGLIRARRKARKPGKTVVFPGDTAQPKKETAAVKSDGFDQLLKNHKRSHNL